MQSSLGEEVFSRSWDDDVLATGSAPRLPQLNSWKSSA